LLGIDIPVTGRTWRAVPALLLHPPTMSDTTTAAAMAFVDRLMAPPAPPLSVTYLLDAERRPPVGSEQVLCVPKSSSISCDQAVLVDQAADASLFSDAVLVEVDRLG
jgi:hypothetical protein